MSDIIADEVTGIRTRVRGGGPIYDSHGGFIDDNQAYTEFCNGRTIEVPNAGAGCLADVMERMNLTETEVVEQSSSAGDWTYLVKDGDFWYVVSQENRWPRSGFRYTRARFGCPDKDQAMAEACGE
jgi:hypothetical protein